MTPASPMRAHHRFLKNMTKTFFGDKGVDPTPEEFDLVASVFSRAGGSWERLYGGSVDDVNLLRKTLQIAIKGGHISKSSDWKK